MSATEAGTRWWPSLWGEGDQLGMLNHIDDAVRAEALVSVRHGRLYDLGRVLDETVPAFPGRYFRQTLVTTAHHANHGGVGDNQVNWITEVVTGTQQLGTHLDALAHLQMGERAYNGWRVGDLAGDGGVHALGVETVPQIVTRGHLVDVAARRGVDRLRGGEVIGLDDVADLEVRLGDAVFFHTGHGALWNDAAAYLDAAATSPASPRSGTRARSSGAPGT
jgi:kynurenine formamidase